MTTGHDPETSLRFRMYVDGRLVDEVWIDMLDPDAETVDSLRERHRLITDAADERGQTWLVEVWDPVQAEDRAYVRFGTDRDGMVEPVTVAPSDFPTR